jgi:hypothetical protein
MLFTSHGEEAMKRSNDSKWHKQFKEGQKNMEDDKRSGCPSKEPMKMLGRKSDTNFK